jgi:hypothetical protein
VSRNYLSPIPILRGLGPEQKSSPVHSANLHGWIIGLLALKVNLVAGLAIQGYLEYCRRHGLSVTPESAFMADAQRRQLARHPQLWKEGLRMWTWKANR